MHTPISFAFTPITTGTSKQCQYNLILLGVQKKQARCYFTKIREVVTQNFHQIWHAVL